MQLYQLREGDWLGIGCMAIGLGSLIAMLEEGQRDDWLGSVFIQRCALLAAIFIPAFVIIELSRKKPFSAYSPDATLESPPPQTSSWARRCTVRFVSCRST
jgi:hypothetical protein